MGHILDMARITVEYSFLLPIFISSKHFHVTMSGPKRHRIPSVGSFRLLHSDLSTFPSSPTFPSKTDKNRNNGEQNEANSNEFNIVGNHRYLAKEMTSQREGNRPEHPPSTFHVRNLR